MPGAGCAALAAAPSDCHSRASCRKMPRAGIAHLQYMATKQPQRLAELDPQQRLAYIDPNRRLAYIDWMRGLACLLMFQTHCYDSWLGAPARATKFFWYSQLVGTAPAPL